MKHKIVSAFCLSLLLGCSSQPSSSPAPSEPPKANLNGTWLQTSIGCEKNPEDKFFAKERQAIIDGKAKNTLTISDGKVETRYWKHRMGDPSDKGHCTLVLNQEWEVGEKSYRVLKIEAPQYEDTESAMICALKAGRPAPAQKDHTFELNGDQLRIFSLASRSGTRKKAVKVCAGNRMMITYKRIK